MKDLFVIKQFRFIIVYFSLPLILHTTHWLVKVRKVTYLNLTGSFSDPERRNIPKYTCGTNHRWHIYWTDCFQHNRLSTQNLINQSYVSKVLLFIFRIHHVPVYLLCRLKIIRQCQSVNFISEYDFHWIIYVKVSIPLIFYGIIKFHS